MLDEILARDDELQFIAVFGGMAILFLIEVGIPRRPGVGSQAQRWLSNISLTLFNYYLVALLSVYLSVVASWLQPEIPLLSWVELPITASVFLTIFIVDFVNYWIHRGFHRFSLLWRIHAVHHTDIQLDVTTANRHHPFESMINLLLILPVAVLLGAPIIAAIVYTYLSILVNLFSHANIRLPKWLDRILRVLIVTPDFHRMHHSSNRRYIDSNYGSIFPWFDYVFGTASRLAYYKLPNMRLGLEKLRQQIDGRLDKLLTLPFTYRK